jgi:hypothetical protein
MADLKKTVQSKKFSHVQSTLDTGSSVIAIAKKQSEKNYGKINKERCKS